MRPRFSTDRHQETSDYGEELSPFDRIVARLHILLPGLFSILAIAWVLAVLLVPRPVFESPEERKQFVQRLGGSGSETGPILLVASWCGACKYLEKVLQQEGIPYLRGDIESNMSARDLYERATQRSSRTIPKVIIGDYLVSHSLKSIKESLAQQR
jgi:glutaredoxin